MLPHFDSTVGRLLKAAIDGEIANDSEQVVTIPVKSFEEYHLRVGRIRGLKAALELLAAVERRLSTGGQ